MTNHLRTLLPGVVLVLVCCASGCAAETGEDEEGIDEAVAGLTNDQLESKLIAEVNKRRAAAGLQKVSGGACVDSYAESWAGHLVATGGWYHQSMSPIITNCGGLWAGEALATGSAALTAAQFVTGWMNSPEHRDVILKPRADRVGMGVRSRPNGDKVIVADFLDKPNE